jgi:curved DNA-binding protein CbpA
METVHRVFRIMAARFHPDNPETGDSEEFLRLKKAYDVLSEPGLRAEYDSIRESNQINPMPIFELKDFVTGVEAESNRRLGVLALLYNQRRSDPDHPAISLLNLEQRMGFPREYLSFTMWYLRAKQYVAAADNSDYALTAAGVDHVEGNAAQSEIVAKLLKLASGHSTPAAKPRAPKPENPARPGPWYLPEATTTAR